MTGIDNPYLPSSTPLPTPPRRRPPMALKLALGLYALTYLMALAAAALQGFDALPYSAIGWALLALFTLAVSLALLAGKGWARVWIIALTCFPVISLVVFQPWTAEPVAGSLAMLRIGSRIAVGLMMFLPSVVAWFEPRVPAV